MVTGIHSELRRWQRTLLVLLASIGMLASQTIGVALAASSIDFRGLSPADGTPKTTLTPDDGIACLQTIIYRATITDIPVGSGSLYLELAVGEIPTGGIGTIGLRSLESVSWTGPGYTVVTNELGTPFTDDAVLAFDLDVTGLTSGTLEFGLMIGCTLPFSFNGVIQIAMAQASVTPAGGGVADTINVGGQTNNLKAGGADLSSITITKATPSPTGDSFDFTEALGAATRRFSLLRGGSEIILNVFPGTYTFTEDDETGWTVSDIACSKVDGRDATTTTLTEDEANRRATVVLGLDTDVTCTFTNTVTPAPAMTVVKEISDDAGATWQDADTAPGVAFDLGDTVDYKLVVTNTGNVGLTGVTLSDSLYTLVSSLGGATACTIPTTLAVGGSFTCYARTTATVGTTTNTATADSSETAQVTDPAVYTVASAPAMTVVKEISDNGGTTWQDADTAPGVAFDLGDTVDYKLVVTNTGNVGLTGVTLSDSLYTLVSSLGGATACTIPTTLAVGGSFTCYAHTTATVGTTTNTATADSTETAQVTDPAVYTVASAPAMTVVKEISDNGGTTWQDADTAPGVAFDLGDTVDYKLVVTNTGNVDLTGVTLSDRPLHPGVEPRRRDRLHHPDHPRRGRQLHLLRAHHRHRRHHHQHRHRRLHRDRPGHRPRRLHRRRGQLRRRREVRLGPGDLDLRGRRHRLRPDLPGRRDGQVQDHLRQHRQRGDHELQPRRPRRADVDRDRGRRHRVPDQRDPARRSHRLRVLRHGDRGRGYQDQHGDRHRHLRQDR